MNQPEDHKVRGQFRPTLLFPSEYFPSAELFTRMCLISPFDLGWLRQWSPEENTIVSKVNLAGRNKSCNTRLVTPIIRKDRNRNDCDRYGH